MIHDHNKIEDSVRVPLLEAEKGDEKHVHPAKNRIRNRLSEIFSRTKSSLLQVECSSFQAIFPLIFYFLHLCEALTAHAERSSCDRTSGTRTAGRLLGGTIPSQLDLH